MKLLLAAGTFVCVGLVVDGEVIPRSAPWVDDGAVSFVGARCRHLICRPSSWAKLDIAVSHFKQLDMAF